MAEDTLSQRWERVRAGVAAACRQAGRDPSEVTILPVSKTHPVDVIEQALALGLQRLGENRVQEIRDKAAALPDRGIEWVVIGHLQTNKAKYVAQLAREVQSLDRLDLAEALQRRLDMEQRELDVLVQVKTSPEPSKYGLPPEDLLDFLEKIREFPCLHVRGLMTMAIQSDDETPVRACFRMLRELRDRAQAAGHDLPRLSMGMSGDFALAIDEGSTEVRIGTAIFGTRAAG
ncbi:YggS family pyridoxal phosphate-dependent enzyme [Oleiagrimonas sp.]|jgi:pyridoxal phosphate enzyme (YggS family)|uniref:YggS family pyridoxal phosphate-dependent enzyme n=1 Tax=Oleiagrimonas sp. TaxID=2010330 RepID=UPI00260C1AB1|nr:YggS family pyridoxal phosphate-dependent enzyme [Oleiagrimonas sp.]MDA3914468.1 YggS family pyridoxal phosphate-dependent enzyme [Oleiagrimonas sp.]